MRAKLFPTKMLGLSAFSALAFSLVPQAQIEIVRKTDVLLDGGGNTIGTVATLRKMAVSGTGDGLAEVDTTGASSGDELVWTGFGVGIREGDALTAPVGAAVGDVNSMQINSDGDIAYNLRLLGQPTATGEALYINLNLLLQEGDDASAFGFNAGAIVDELDYIRMSPRSTSGDVYILADALIDDSGVDIDTVLLIQTDPTGTTVNISAVLTEGDIVDMSNELVCPLPPVAVTTISLGLNSIDVSSTGETIIVARVAGGSANDYLVLKNGTDVLAREGCLSPAGVNWSSLSGAEVGINDVGDTVLSGVLAGSASTNLLIAKNNTVFKREGSTFAAIGGGLITNFGSGPIDVEDGSGDVLWYCEWSGALPGAALFKSDEPLIQVGQTQASGETVSAIDDSFDGYAISPDGSRAIAILDTTDALLNVVEGVWHAGEVSNSSIVQGLPCTSLGTLSHTAGSAAINDSFTLTFSDGPANVAFCILFFSPKNVLGQPASNYDPLTDCGLPLLGLGDAFIGVAPLIDVFPLFGEYKVWTGATPVDYTFDLTATLDPPSLVGLQFIWQGAFFSGASGAQPIRLTNAVKTTFGT